MASSTSPQFTATVSRSTEDQATIARHLIAANELYKISNSTEYSLAERKQALAESGNLTREVLRHSPHDASALNLMARIDLDNSDRLSAETLLLRALEIDPENNNTRMNYAYLLIAQRKYGAAEREFLTILEHDKSSSQAFSGIALTKLRRKDYVGAFHHYRRLIELGHQSHSLKVYFLEAIEFLTTDHYDASLEALLLNAFAWENVDHTKLSSMAGSLLIEKYDLRNEQAILDLDALLVDEFLLRTVESCLLKTVELEALLVELRRSILTEVTMTQSLRDELQPFAIALGAYSARVDHVLMISESEENEVAYLKQQIHQSCRGQWTQDDIAGALIILSMYESLYSQSFSYSLLKYEKHEWPLGMQALVEASLYDLCNEHQMYFDLFGDSRVSMTNNEIDRATERWTSFPALAQSDIYTALCNELGEANVPARFETQKIKILLVGCGSGQRAAYLSQYFSNVEVYAIDDSRANIAYAHMKARQHGLTNLHFLYTDYESPIITDDRFDIIEFGEAINHVRDPDCVLREWKMLLESDGLIRLSLNSKRTQEVTGVIRQLVRDRGLSPTTDNIRHLRNAIAQEAGSGLWDALFADEQFYTGTGCKDLFFNTHNHYFDLKDVHRLLNETKFSFVGFADLSDRIKSECNPLAPYNLLAWHVMDQDKALFSDAYQMYCTPSVNP